MPTGNLVTIPSARYLSVSLGRGNRPGRLPRIGPGNLRHATAMCFMASLAGQGPQGDLLIFDAPEIAGNLGSTHAVFAIIPGSVPASARLVFP